MNNYYQKEEIFCRRFEDSLNYKQRFNYRYKKGFQSETLKALLLAGTGGET